MHEIAETIQVLSTYAAYTCAAAVGVCIVGVGALWVAQKYARGGRKVAAASLVGAMLIGAMVVVGTDGAGSKPSTNDVSQVEGGTNTVAQTEVSTNDWTNVEGTNTVGQTDGEGTNGISGGTRFCASGLGVVRPRGSAALPVVTDDDIAAGWRVVSVSSNMLATATFTMPPHAMVWESAQACGRGWGAWHIPIGGWNFTYGDDGWTNGFAWVEGYFRSKFRSRANEIRLLSERLALCPAAHWSRYNLAASRAWSATNDVDGLVVTFENVAIGDDPTKIASVQMELFPRTSEVVLRYDLANVGDATYTAGLVVNGTNHFVEVGAGTREVVFQRVHPDDWDMDGIPNSIDDTPREPSPNTGYNQTDAWAMAAFPSNLVEIATMGYAMWVAARAAEPNRHLIGLQVSSPENVWPICLTFGDKQMMCDGSEMLYFAIDDGARYSFELSDGALAAVDFDGSEMLDAIPVEWCFPWEYRSWPCMVTLHVDSARSGWIGRTAEVSVDGLYDSHFFPNDSETVTAVVTNCHEDAYIDCTWSGGSGFVFASPHSLSTEVIWIAADDTPWSTNGITLVTRYLGGYALTNTVMACVGPEHVPPTGISLSCQDVLFLNDDLRPERVYAVTVGLTATNGVTGQVTLSCDGAESTLSYFKGIFLPDRIPALTFPLGVSSNDWFTTGKTVFMSCSALGEGELSATISFTNGTSCATSCVFNVIEPLRKLVNKDKRSLGHYYNPSRPVYGDYAYLRVDVNGHFNPGDVDWRVVKGPGRVVSHVGLLATVEATADEGVVEVEARFNEDEIQPKFVLPIVRERVLDVKVFVVSSPEGDTALVEDDFQNLLKDVNRIFYQVGIRFNLAGYTCIPNSSKYWVLPMQKVERHFWRSDELVASDELKQLLGEYQRMPGYTGSDCIEVYVVGSLVPANIGGLNYPGEGVVIPSTCSAIVLAHELGHALGFLDCYQSKALDENDPSAGDMSIQVDMINASCFQSRPNDWGAETGCGFYPMTDSITTIYAQLLMNGKAVVGGIAGVDIPDGEVWCVTGNAFGATGIGFTPVGASNILPSNEQVYTK